MKEIRYLSAEKARKDIEKYSHVYSRNGKIVVTGLCPGQSSYDQVNCVRDRELDFESRLSDYQMSADFAENGLDNVPSISMGFGSVAYLMGIAYGAQPLYMNQLVSAEPIFRSVDDVREFEKIVPVEKHGFYPEICDRIEEFQVKYPEIPIGICDNQSPINVLTSILHSQEAIYAMYDEPEVIHHVMKCITESIMEVNQHLAGIIRNFKGFTAQHFNALPKGMQVSDDNAAFLSPSLYKEFAVPYAEKLAAEFGGLNFHCCRGYEQNLSAIAQVNGFLGFDPQVDFNNIDKILDAVTGRGVWLVNNFKAQQREDRKETDFETFRRIIDQSEGRCSLVIDVWGDTMEEALRLANAVKEYAAKKGRLQE